MALPIDCGLPVAPSDTWHVLPLDDAAPHVESADCPCKPKVQAWTNPQGVAVRLVVHNSFDGREFWERAVAGAEAEAETGPGRDA